METSSRFDEEANKIEFGTIAEQKDETAYDRRRRQTDDESEEGQLDFPTDRLYGREEELGLLKELCQPEVANGSPEGFKSRAIFIGGISGAGKSALVKQTVEDLRMDSKSFFFVSGKYSISRTKPPFSAISEGMKRLIRDTVRCSSKEDLKQIRKRLFSQQLSEDSQDTMVLASAIVPSLPKLFRKSNLDDSASFSTSLATATGIGYDINAIKYAFLNFVKSFPTRENPLVFFLDDLQWADEASLSLLTWLLKDKTVRNLVFVGSYRSNEVDTEHPFYKLMTEMKEVRGDDMPTHSLEVANLGPDDIAEFIADSLERDVEEVMALAEVVYSKTLGNIFFVKQALEELVRCDAMYYDIVSYEWQIRDINRVALEQFLNEDVVALVKNKLYTLPLPLQRALSIAAFTRNVIDSETLLALLEAEDLVAGMDDLHKLLQKAVRQGILLELHSVDDDERGTIYKFAHDRIQEASMACVPKGEERDQLLERIAKILSEIGSEETNEWMLFVAVHHVNKLPAEMVDGVDAAALNLRVGKLALSKAAFSQAADLLRIGNDRLDKSIRWVEHYGLTLGVLNSLLEIEHVLGNEESAIALAKEVLRNAKTLPEKRIAYVVSIEATCQLHNRDYGRAISEAVVILKENGINVPENPSSRDVLRENLRLSWKQLFRPLPRLIASYPPSSDPTFNTQLKLMSVTIFYANVGKNFNLGTLLAYRAIRLILTRRIISNDTASIILSLAIPRKKKQQFKAAMSYANASQVIVNRFPDEPPKSFALVKFMMLAGFLPIQLPFKETVNKYLELQKSLLSSGETNESLTCAMLVSFAFFNAGLPITGLLEPKLQQLQELAASLKRGVFVTLFTLFRQVLYNLQGKSADPPYLNGPILWEEKVLQGSNANMIKASLRDISMHRLMLATILDNEVLMEEMLDRLDEYPVFDPPIARQHMRLSWVGLAAAILESRGKTKHSSWTKTSSKYFDNLCLAGSPNAQLLASCLIALTKRSKSSFDQAIEACSAANNFCLAGLMNECCAEYVTKGDKEHEEYLMSAYWSYQDWGAVAKIRQMEERYSFLSSKIRQDAPVPINALMRNTGLMGLAPPPESSAGTGY